MRTDTRMMSNIIGVYEQRYRVYFSLCKKI